MKIVTDQITIPELQKMAQRIFGGLVKAVVDIEKEIMVVDAQMHADQEKYLLEHKSDQINLWGINLYPDIEGDDFIEFDSMINLRPSYGNNSRSVDDENTRKKIRTIVNKLVKR